LRRHNAPHRRPRHDRCRRLPDLHTRGGDAALRARGRQGRPEAAVGRARRRAACEPSMMDGVTRIPVACTLTADDAAARVEEWRAFMAGRVEAAERSELAVRLRLRPDD